MGLADRLPRHAPCRFTEPDSHPPPQLLCNLRDEAERLWAEEVAAASTKRPNGKPDIVKGLCFPIARNAIVLGYTLNIVSGCFTTIVRPLLSKLLIDALRDDSTTSSTAGWVLCGALCATVFLERWTTVQGSLYAGDEGPLRIVTALTHLVAKKTIELQVGAGKEGFETALLGNDLVRGSEMAKIMPLLPLGISCSSACRDATVHWRPHDARRRRRHVRAARPLQARHGRSARSGTRAPPTRRST